MKSDPHHCRLTCVNLPAGRILPKSESPIVNGMPFSVQHVATSVIAAQNAEGTGLAPFECWLALRGVKTMALRMERQAENAARIADFLAAHPLVTRVNYPGLPGHPGAALHAAQATHAGSLLSFETGRCA